MIEVIKAADDCVELTGFTPEVDLIALFGRPAQNVYVVDAGASTKQLVVVCAGSRGVTRSYTTQNGWTKDLKVTKILSASTVVSVQVSL